MSELLNQLRNTIWAQKIYYPLKNIEYELFFKRTPELFIQREYKRRVKSGKKLNLDNPQRLTEKMNWLKLYYTDEILMHLGDKYYAREYVRERIGEKYLVPVYDYFTKADQLDLQKYPDKFVIKGTHNSGDVVLCQNKEELDEKKLKKLLRVWLNKDFYKKSKEPSYIKAVPGIIVEQYLDAEQYKTPKDYKIFCFNGTPLYIGVYSDRYGENKRVGQIVYDVSWNIMPFIFGTVNKFDRDITRKEAAPKCLKEMLEISKILAENFPFVRIDLYVINEKIYFGEMTFFHLNGYFQCTPLEWDELLGKQLDISKINEARYCANLEIGEQ